MEKLKNLLNFTKTLCRMHENQKTQFFKTQFVHCESFDDKCNIWLNVLLIRNRLVRFWNDNTKKNDLKKD